jgi:hypothetical protein
LATLDGGDFGWLKAKHHVAVTADGNPANGPLGAFVVWNDDEIAPGVQTFVDPDVLESLDGVDTSSQRARPHRRQRRAGHRFAPGR